MLLILVYDVDLQCCMLHCVSIVVSDSISMVRVYDDVRCQCRGGILSKAYIP